MTSLGRAWAVAGRYRATLAVTAALAAVLGWLSAEAGSPDWSLVGVVLAAGTLSVGVREGTDDRDRQETYLAIVVGGGVVVLLGILSGWSPSSLVFIGITVLIYVLFSLGLNLEFGYTGILNFGHVAFMGIGAYTTTLLSRWWVVDGGLPVGDPSPMTLALVAGAALLVLVLVSILASAAFEPVAARLLPDRSVRTHQRTGLAAGAIVAVLAAAALLASIGWPPDPVWAPSLVVGASALLGMALAALFGVLLGIPTLRLREDYLAIVTIGAAEILRRFWTNEAWLTDGPRGVVGFPVFLADAPQRWAWVGALARRFSVSNPYKVLLFLLVAGTVIVVYVFLETLIRAPYGRVLKAVREDEEAAKALGKNVFVVKLQSLAMGSAVAALAGSFLAWHRVYINPNTFLPIITFYAFIIVVVGGMGDNRGTVVGALVLWGFFEITRRLPLAEKLGLSSTEAAAFRVAAIGVLLMVAMMVKPEGILGREEEMVLGD